MTASTAWVQDKIELFEGELLVFKRPNSPNWYLRIWISIEKKYLQQSLKTKSQFDAIEKAKAIYKETQLKVAKEEKVFTITLGEAIVGYEAEEKKRERRGIIQTDWYNKKNSYLRNIFTHHFGEAKRVNDISEAEMSEYIDIRLKRCKRKQTIKQEIVIIKHFYKTYLIKKGYVFRIPEFPEFRLKQKDISRREDTFSIPEYEKLIRFMREWVKEKNVSKVRKAEKKYGKTSNTEKVLREWEWQMECHRRILLRELILIGANTGIRCPKEMLSLTWGDIKVRSETFKGLYTNPDKESAELIAYIQINQQQKTGARQVVGKAGVYFKRLKQYYRDQFEFNPQDHHPVFMDMVGRRKYQVLDRYALYRLWGELMRDCNLTRIDFTLYSLRGFYITQSILNGIDITLISKNCGNSPSTIYKHYEFIDMERNVSQLVKRRDTKKEVANEVEI